MTERIIVLLGRRSFIGRHLERYFRARGSLTVVAVSSSECDLADGAAVHRLFADLGGATCDVLFLSAVNKWQDNSYAAFARNVAMTHAVLQALPASTRSLTYFSSADVYGFKPPLPIAETTPANPDSWYGMAKHVAEWVVTAGARPSCPVTVLRLPGVYGADDVRSIVSRFAGALRQQNPVRLTGNGGVRRDYVYVQDICRLVEALLEHPYDGVLNVATGDSLTLREIVSALAGALGTEPAIAYGLGDADREFDMEFDNRRLRAVLPDFTFTSLPVAARTYAAR